MKVHSMACEQNERAYVSLRSEPFVSRLFKLLIKLQDYSQTLSLHCRPKSSEDHVMESASHECRVNVGQAA